MTLKELKDWIHDLEILHNQFDSSELEDAEIHIVTSRHRDGRINTTRQMEHDKLEIIPNPNTKESMLLIN